MLKINQVKVPILSDKEVIQRKIAKLLDISVQEIIDYEILRHSIDARKGELFDVYQVKVETVKEPQILKKHKKDPMISVYHEIVYDFWKRRNDKEHQIAKLSHPPIIIGAGPAGLFCAYELARHGYCPIIVERGKCVQERQKDVDTFLKQGILHPNSNVQFGEGGAGAFSDGKLNTLIKDTEGRSRHILSSFVQFGAHEDILYEHKPHIGTDVLYDVLIHMREEILRLGGRILFEHQVVEFDIRDQKLEGIYFHDGSYLPVSVCVLAIGHSARDTFMELAKTQIQMEAKSFAVGFRVEHPQEMINELQYGKQYAHKLPAAPYKLTATTASGRGVYSFCMCPGGYVVNASSQEGGLAVNGMSYHDRDGKNANSAIIVSVTPEDFPQKDALGGVKFQYEIEKRAYELGHGKIPQQLFGDFIERVPSKAYGDFSSETKGASCLTNVREILPEPLNEAFIEGMHQFGQKMRGFDRKDAILSGIESRTSSPVRIPRDESFMSNIVGLYPCGEGAGYAGGIMSAAIDGLKVAEAIAANYEPYEKSEE